MKDVILQENIESLKKTRDKLKKELAEFEQAIAELERLGKIAEATRNDPGRLREYQEAANRIPLQKMDAVGLVFVIGGDAIQEYNNLGGHPEKEIVDKKDLSTKKYDAGRTMDDTVQ